MTTPLGMAEANLYCAFVIARDIDGKNISHVFLLSSIVLIRVRSWR